MRKLLVVSVLLAAAAPVFGVGGKPSTMSLTTPGAVLVGNEYQIQYADVAGGFDIEVMLETTDGTGMGAFAVRLDGDPGFAYDMVDANAYPTLANYNAANNWVNNAEGGAGLWLGGNLPMPAADPNYYCGTVYKGTVAFPPPPVTYWGKNGLGVTIHISALPPVGDYTIGVVADGSYITDSSFNNAELSDTTLTVIPLHILPEPVSALLLLAGLPMLRRRR
jgi:hypothetical protein